MRTSTMVLLGCAALAGGCKKKGGGGGSWLVGEDGLMANVNPDETLGGGYDPGVGDCTGITCLDDETAFVVGDGGVFLRNVYGGQTWERRDLGTIEDLRKVDAAWPGTIEVAGADGLYRSEDLGSTWTRHAAGGWRAVAIDDDGATTIALDDEGGVWRDDASVAALAGARAVSLSHDGRVAAVTGGGVILRSTDAGDTWARFDADADLDAVVRASDDETVMAVGAAGAMVAVAPEGTVRVAGFGGPDLHALYLEDTVGYAVGDAGAVYKMSGGAWTRLDLGLTGTILAVEDLDGGW